MNEDLEVVRSMSSISTVNITSCIAKRNAVAFEKTPLGEAPWRCLRLGPNAYLQSDYNNVLTSRTISDYVAACSCESKFGNPIVSCFLTCDLP